MREPDFSGTRRKAWTVPHDPEAPTRIDALIVFSPGESPAWSYYFLGLADLAPIEAKPPARLDFPDARWEFGVYAMEGVPDPDDPTTWRFLTPQNVVVQVPDHPLELVVGVMRALGPVLVADGTWLPLEPMFQRDLDPVWREIIEATLAHPHHRTL